MHLACPSSLEKQPSVGSSECRQGEPGRTEGQSSDPDLAGPIPSPEAAKWYLVPFAPFTLFEADHLEPSEAAREQRPPDGHWTPRGVKELIRMSCKPTLPPEVRS